MGIGGVCKGVDNRTLPDCLREAALIYDGGDE